MHYMFEIISVILFEEYEYPDSNFYYRIFKRQTCLSLLITRKKNPTTLRFKHPYYVKETVVVVTIVLSRVILEYSSLVAITYSPLNIVM